MMDEQTDVVAVGRRAERRLDVGWLHGAGGRDDGGRVALVSRKEPTRITVGHPVLTKQGQGAPRQGNVAVLGPLPQMHMDEQPDR